MSVPGALSCGMMTYSTIVTPYYFGVLTKVAPIDSDESGWRRSDSDVSLDVDETIGKRLTPQCHTFPEGEDYPRGF